MPDDVNPNLATVANMRRFEEENPGRDLPDGGHVEGRRCFAYSPSTGEQVSASPGDYFTLPDDQPLLDSNDEPMVLAVSREVISDALTPRPERAGDEFICPHEGCDSTEFQEVWRVASSARMDGLTGHPDGRISGTPNYDGSEVHWDDVADTHYECASCCREVDLWETAAIEFQEQQERAKTGP